MSGPILITVDTNSGPTIALIGEILRAAEIVRDPKATGMDVWRAYTRIRDAERAFCAERGHADDATMGTFLLNEADRRDGSMARITAGIT